MCRQIENNLRTDLHVERPSLDFVFIGPCRHHRIPERILLLESFFLFGELTT